MGRTASSRMENRVDFLMLTASLLLILGGLVMIYSASAVISESKFGDSAYFVKRQFLYLIPGVLLAWFFSRVEIKKLELLVWPALILSGLSLLAVLTPQAGVQINGARRWLKLGMVSFQPSEFAKLSLILFMAYYLAKKKEKIREFRKGLLPCLFIVAIFLKIILAEPDFGSAVIIGAVFFLMIYEGGARIKHLFFLFLLSLPFIYHYLQVGFRKQRMLAFLDPWKEQGGEGFQVVQSYLAFAGGGPFGTGLGASKQKLFYLPEPYTDFIYSVIGEELGLAGTLGVLLLFSILIYRGFQIALKTEDLFSFYLASGITFLIFIQVFVNICVVTGLFPTKGLPLPFISYGGSSLWVNLISIGLLMNLSRKKERRERSRPGRPAVKAEWAGSERWS
ncbi:MAG: putative lipid II flippase FtsW [Nitrospirae bacterium]|nr:putative lipid II flippase FtsW [Nitrospirota bacterium]